MRNSYKGKTVMVFPARSGDGAGFFGSSATDEQVKKVLEIYEDFDFWMPTFYGVEDTHLKIKNCILVHFSI